MISAIYALLGAPSARVVGLIMAFGSGVLISAVAYELVASAFVESGGSGVVAAGLAIGALTYFGGDVLIARRSTTAEGGGLPIVLGAVLDGIPESMVIGISMLGGGGVSVAMVVAVFVSNLPEGIAATVGLRTSNVSAQRILGMWLALSFVFAAAARSAMSWSARCRSRSRRSCRRSRPAHC
jgi:ZIP family zinc transporter